MKTQFTISTLSLLLLFFTTHLSAQISTPPSGDNQKSSVTQWIGLTSVTVTYNSPNVTSPQGDDRKGKIWGQLVPYGMNNLGFGLSSDEFPSPWRAGANENTTIEFSHDVKIEGKNLAAGTYGLHIIVEEGDEWTVIFSKNASSWGSYFYKENEDALRVKVKTEKAEFREFLTYEFVDRQLDYAVCALFWEYKKVPFKIEVENMTDLYLAQIRDELRGAKGFSSQSLAQAANFCLQKNTNLEEALQWAEASISAPFIGVANFNTLSTKARVLAALGKEKESEEAMNVALAHPTTTASDVYGYGRQLIAQDKDQQALTMFEQQVKKNPNTWYNNHGLARAYSAIGDFKKAVKYEEIALKNEDLPASSKPYLEGFLEKLKNKEDIN